MSKPSDIMARLNKGAAAQEEKKEKRSKKREAVVAQRDFEISEADIKANPAYAILTDEKLTDQKKIEALHDLKRYNEELTEEQNEANREASNEVLLYVENQLMAASQKGIEFTNDDAFALYDSTIQELFDNIGTFKGYIEPFVKALEVLQKARDAGVPANELIDAVSQMQTDIAAMESEKGEKEAELARLEGELAGFNEEATGIAQRLEGLAGDLTRAKAAKKEAQGSWNVLKRGGRIEDAERDIADAQRQIAALESSAGVNADNLERQNGQIEALRGEIDELGTKITTSTDEFNSNEDFPAIATLIEITGEDFKDKRTEVVKSAQTITEKAIAGIEKSIGRFESGEGETQAQLNTVKNLNGMVGLLSAADREVRTSDQAFVSSQREIVDRIKAEKGEDAIHDPAYETAKKHLDAATEHVEDVMDSAARASDLEGKLTTQTSTFGGLNRAYGQKRNDAVKLRTSAAVEIPSQLAITVKSVEMATATESNNMVNDAFADLSATTRNSVSSIFDTVAAGADQNNEQLREALSATMDTLEMLDRVDSDRRAAAEEQHDINVDLSKARSALKDMTESVAHAAVEADHGKRAATVAEEQPTP